MDAAQRRQQILLQLRQSTQPVSASALAEHFHVSRQVIVGDIALLRAANASVFATPRGYVLNHNTSADGIMHTIACKHDNDNLAEELYAVVDSGCGLIDVIVEHPLYGQLSGQLHIFSRYDADCFLEKLAQDNAAPLSNLTGGIHLHTVFCQSEQAYERMIQKLKEKNILFVK